jgi:ABC-type multidrug transport system ATPase subunit
VGKIDDSWRTSGSLLINGEPGRMQDFRKLIGFVPQEDIMLRELTVEENIRFSARMRLPRSWSSEQVDEHVRAVIESLQLAPIAQSVIGDDRTRGISGGQRKRVNIGIELAAAPLALFLDEPTSGLDAASALEVCDVLRDVAQHSGITVAMVLHQPRVEIWRNLDNLLLLAPGGSTAYLGRRELVEPYFLDSLSANIPVGTNPADIIMDIIGSMGTTVTEFWETTGKHTLEVMETTGHKRTPSGMHYFDTPDPKNIEIAEVSIYILLFFWWGRVGGERKKEG